MANLITSVPTIETDNFELFVKPLIDDPKINELPISVVFGNTPREHFYNDNLDKVMREKLACGWNFVGAVDITKKPLTQVEVQAAVEQCYTVFLNKFWGGKLPNGFQRGELFPELTNFITGQQNYAFNRDLLSLLLLGDQNKVEGTPYYSIMDGLYTKLKAGVPDGVVDAGALTATSLNPTNFFDTMNAVYNAQSRLLKGVAKNMKTWMWTESVYELYLNYLEKSTQGTAGITQTSHVTDGLSAMTFKGIPITVLSIVDERLESDFLDNSGNVINPYRVILTKGDEHTLYIDGTAFENSNMWYEKKDDKVYSVGSALIAYEFGYPELNVIAGF